MIGSLSVFAVEFLRDHSRFNVDTVLNLSALSFLGALAVLPFSGQMVDSTGSKPLMRAAIGMFAIVTAGWGLVAANVLPYSTTLVALLNLGAGVASANFNLANVRITMATMPKMGRIISLPSSR